MFDWDGSLRDIYVFGTSESEWDRFLDALRSWGYDTTFWIDGEPADLPDSAGEVFELRERSAPLLQVDLGGILLCCHFFTPEEVEIDVDPRDITDGSRLNQLVVFMRQLGQALVREVVLTPENQEHRPIIRYDPISDEHVLVA